MNYFIATRGAPGSGKSTVLDYLGLSQYAICPDNIRLLCQSPQLNINGKSTISLRNDNYVWKLVFELTEKRMERGELVVIDATFSKTSDFSKFKKLIEKYRYRVLCLDFSNVTLEECLYRNSYRDEHKVVPENVIRVMYERLKTQKIPGWANSIDFSTNIFYDGILVGNGINEFNDKFIYKIHDYNNYDKIHHIGDIHSCYDVLKEYFNTYGHPKNKPKELFIFIGDLLDRGPQPVEVINEILDIYKLENVIIIQGNHEKWLRNHAEDTEILSKEYLLNTKIKLEEANISLKEIRKLCRTFYNLEYYTFNNKEVLVTHGGLSTLPDNLLFVALDQIIKGVGSYKDMPEITQTFTNTTNENQYQIFGHRNIQELPNPIHNRNYCLEGQVEFGGYLRAVILDKNGFIPIYIKNNNFNNINTKSSANVVSLDNMDIINKLRSSRNVIEKKFINNISSFNFNRDTFNKGLWDKITLQARGLFIDTVTGEIVARSYNKFFNIDENEYTSINNLSHNLVFPLKIYKKENGFLGMLGYQKSTDNMVIATKSSLDGKMNELFVKNLFTLYSNEDIQGIKDYLKINNTTIVLEICDSNNDPHIIKYDDPKIYLLDIIYNEFKFAKKPYDELIDDAKKLKLETKELYFTINNWEEFLTWYNNTLSQSLMIEGYVIEDSIGFMLKIKTNYYNFWKKMRNLTARVAKNKSINMGQLYDIQSNKFYEWLLANKLKIESPVNIIKLREFFNKESINENILS